MQGRVVYIRPKVIGSFSEPYTRGSYMHQAALFYIVNLLTFNYYVLFFAERCPYYL
jgi:hypothetical protein